MEPEKSGCSTWGDSFLPVTACLKGAIGEVALRLGAENEAFGVINVGDDAKLVKLCEGNGLAPARTPIGRACCCSDSSYLTRYAFLKVTSAARG